MFRIERGALSFTRVVADLLAVNRFSYLGFAAVTLIALANLTAWLRVPGILSVDDGGQPYVVTLASGVEWSWRAIGLGVALGVAFEVARRGWAAPRLRTIAWAYLFFLTCFPSALAYFEPELVARAHSNFWGVERTVADMEYNLFGQETAWRRFQTFSADVVMTAEGIRSPGPDLGWNVLLVSRWLSIVNYHLALPVHVLQSMSFGPLFALFGALALITVAHQSHADPGRSLREIRPQIAVLFGLALLFVLGPKVASTHAYARAESTIGQVPLQQAIAYLEQSIRLDPTRRFSLPVMARLGQRYRAAGLPEEPSAFASRMFELLHAHKYRAALAEIQAGRRRYPEDVPLRFFESIAFEEAGRAAFDQGQTTEALGYWRASRSAARLSAFTVYGESLAALRLDDIESAARELATVAALQQSIGFKRLTIGGQSHLLEAWRLLREGASPGAIHAALALAYQPDKW